MKAKLIRPVHSPRISPIQAQRMTQMLNRRYGVYCAIDINICTNTKGNLRIEFWFCVADVFSKFLKDWSDVWAKYNELMEEKNGLSGKG